MLEVVKYARYVESQQEAEEGPGEPDADSAKVWDHTACLHLMTPTYGLCQWGGLDLSAGAAGCSLCETNRITLEKAWQVRRAGPAMHSSPGHTH